MQVQLTEQAAQQPTGMPQELHAPLTNPHRASRPPSHLEKRPKRQRNPLLPGRPQTAMPQPAKANTPQKRTPPQPKQQQPPTSVCIDAQAALRLAQVNPPPHRRLLQAQRQTSGKRPEFVLAPYAAKLPRPIFQPCFFPFCFLSAARPDRLTPRPEQVSPFHLETLAAKRWRKTSTFPPSSLQRSDTTRKFCAPAATPLPRNKALQQKLGLRQR